VIRWQDAEEIRRYRLQEDQDEELERAAVKIQSVHRGRRLRKEQKELERAAVKIQSVHRGRQHRKRRHSKNPKAQNKDESLASMIDGFGGDLALPSLRLIAYLALRDIYSAAITAADAIERKQQHAAVQLQSAARRHFALKEVKHKRAERASAHMHAPAKNRRESCIPKPSHRRSSMSEDARSAVRKIQTAVAKTIMKRVKPVKHVEEDDRFNPQAMRELLERQQKRATIENRQPAAATAIQRAFRGRQARAEVQKMMEAREEAKKAAQALNSEWETGWERNIRFSFCSHKVKAMQAEGSSKDDASHTARNSMAARRSRRKSRKASFFKLDGEAAGQSSEDAPPAQEAAPLQEVDSPLHEEPAQLQEEAPPPREESALLQEEPPHPLEHSPRSWEGLAGSEASIESTAQTQLAEEEELASRMMLAKSPPPAYEEQKGSNRRRSILTSHHAGEKKEQTPTRKVAVSPPPAYEEKEQASESRMLVTPPPAYEETPSPQSETTPRRKYIKSLTVQEQEQLFSASARIQAAQRGKQARKEAKKMREQKAMEHAAVKIQALCRGWVARHVSVKDQFAAELLEAAALAAASQSAPRPFTRRNLNALWTEEASNSVLETAEDVDSSVCVSVLVCDLAIQFDGESSDGELIDLIVCGSPRCARRPTCCFVQAREVQTEAVVTEELTEVGSSAEDDSTIDSHKSPVALPMPSPQPEILQTKPPTEILQTKPPKRGQQRRRLAPPVTMKVRTLFNTLKPFKLSRLKVDAVRGLLDSAQEHKLQPVVSSTMQTAIDTVPPRPPSNARPPLPAQDDAKPPSFEQLQDRSWQPPPLPMSEKVLADHIGQFAAFDFEGFAPSTPPTMPAEQGPLRPVESGAPSSPLLPPCTPRLGTAELQHEWSVLFASGLVSEEEENNRARNGVARAVNSARQQRPKAADAAASYALPSTRSAKAGTRQFPKKEAKAGMKKLPWLPVAFKEVGHEPGVLNHDAVTFSRRLLDRCYSDASRPGTSNPIVGRLLVEIRQGERQDGKTWRS